jgi:hypothetical protein
MSGDDDVDCRGGNATAASIDETTANALLDDTLKTILTKVVSIHSCPPRWQSIRSEFSIFRLASRCNKITASAAPVARTAGAIWLLSVSHNFLLLFCPR